jgi:hypothetical protein
MKDVSMFIRFYFILAICLNGLSLLGKVQPLGHEEIIHFRGTESAAISAEKSSLGTAYDAVAILSLANKRKDDAPEYYSRLVQGVCLGYGFKNGVQSTLVPSAADRRVFQASLETAGEHLLSTSALPTGAAVWNITSENHDRHAAQMAQWLGLRRAGALDMEYRVPAARYPTAKLLNDASLRTPDPEYAGQNLALTAVLPQLQIDDHTASYDGLRLTNISSRTDLYQRKLCQVCHCHPYNNFDTPISPLAIEYLFTERFIPGVILSFIHNLGIADAQVRFYLNVQENQWNSKQILLRPHALFWMFPNGNKNYAKVGAFAIKDNGEVLADEVSSVYLHGDVASPSNVMILDPGGAAAKFSFTQPEAFYSLVVYGGRAAITRHIFITNAMRDLFQARFQQKNQLPSIEDFLPLLTVEWKQWFIDKGILPA